MDNITHTLVGITLGRTLRSKNVARSRAAIWTAVLGNNFPDLDVIQGRFTNRIGLDRNLEYLLHHRGYTHTILFALIMTPVVAWLGSLLARNRKDWKAMLPLAGLSILLHIAADFMNNYGVHPFFPFNNQWYYGDTLFILEPLLWISILPLGILEIRNWIGKAIFAACYGLLWFLVWFGEYFPLTFQLGLTGLGLVWFFWQYRAKSTIPAWVGLIGVLATFSLSKQKTFDRLTTEFETRVRASASEKLVDLILTVSPSNPWCWNAWWVSTDQQKNGSKEMIARIGNWSWAPTFQPARDCHVRVPTEWKAPVKRPELVLKKGEVVETGAQPDLALLGEYRGSLAEAKKLLESDCTFEQLLRFSRVPFWNLAEDPPIAGDLRYDHGNQMSWAVFPLNRPKQCLPNPPNWKKPSKGLSSLWD